MRFGWRERYGSRGSRTVLREAGVKLPGLLTFPYISFNIYWLILSPIIIAFYEVPAVLLYWLYKKYKKKIE